MPGCASIGPCSQPSRPLRAAFGGGLRPVLTAAARGPLRWFGRDGETAAVSRTEKLTDPARRPCEQAVDQKERRGLRCRWLAVIRGEQHAPLQQDASDPEQPVGDAAQSATVGVATPAQGL